MSRCVQTRPLCIPQGDQRLFIITVRDRHGNLEDISGASVVRFEVYDRQGGSVLLEKTLAATDIIISANDYQFSFTITGPESAALPARRLWYECYMETSASEPATIGAGTFTVQQTGRAA